MLESVSNGKTTASNMKKKTKIIIIGAGMAGLTLALACQAQGMQVKLFDKARALKSIGGGIFLWPHAVRYLTTLGLQTLLQDDVLAANYTNLRGHRGDLLVRDSLADIYSLLDGEIFTIDRSVMQQRFVSALLPDTLFLNKACVGVENKQDYAEVFFADGTTEVADLVVGADGVHSALREFLFPSHAPVHTGFCWWGGMVENHHVPNLPKEDVTYIMGLGKNCSIWPIRGDRFMWYLPVKMPLEQFSREAGIEQARQLAQNWHPDVARIIHAPQCAQHFNVPIYEVAPMKQLCHGRTVLIGDAACTFGPLLGQGVNKAVEDAYLLATMLQRAAPSAELLRHYQSLRMSRHQTFFELEHLSAEALIHDTEVALQQMEAALPGVTLEMMYQDIIPLTNLAADQQLLASLNQFMPTPSADSYFDKIVTS